MIDVSWELAECFIRAHSLRSAQNLELIKFSVDGQAGRCRVGSLLAAAESWMSQVMDDDAAGDYATAEDADLQEEPPAEATTPLPAEEEALTPGFSRTESAGGQQNQGVLFGARPTTATEAGFDSWPVVLQLG